MQAKIMGILNITPDSFVDGGSYFSLEKSVERGKEIAEQGADILDIGGASSKPGAEAVSEEEELRRVIPVIKELQGILPLSIDTCKPRVAQAALEAGASFINDITGFTHPEMCSVAAGSTADVCIMHMQGTPQTMQLNPYYPEGVVEHILSFFDRQIEALLSAGVAESRIVLDPGIGFGKAVEHNREILNSIPQFKSLGFRLLIGISRKPSIAKIVHMPPSEVLQATLKMNIMCVSAGADILRVHDILEHRKTLAAHNFFDKISIL